MHKYIKAVLAVVALSVFALPVKAEEKVWYCEMTGFAETTIEGAKTYRNETFKMKVTDSEVVFGSGGYLDKFTMKISYWRSPEFWRASTKFSVVMFEAGQFSYGDASYERGSVAISARCDDF